MGRNSAQLKNPTRSKPWEVKLTMNADTDFAACKTTREAMTRGIRKVDGAQFAAFARRQGAQTTS
eukprot:389452-Pyramimonas_sp.AAC.1